VDWRFKACLQGVFSLLPWGERLNHVFQRYVTHTLPLDENRFQGMLSTSKQHVENLRMHVSKPLEQAVFYEFGTGWDLLIPLAYWALGIEKQILVDIRPLVRPALVNDAIERFSRIPTPFPLRRKPAATLPTDAEYVQELRKRYGIDYRAPCDARATGMAQDSVDCISSTNALNHIPVGDVRGILRECHRLLGHGGAASFLIDYKDNYSYFDPRISAYNFLRYSEERWRFFSPALHYQNRLRHRDFMILCEEAGFEVVEARTMGGTSEDLRLLQALDLDEQFKRYRIEDLAVRSCWMTLRKRGEASGVSRVTGT